MRRMGVSRVAVGRLASVALAAVLLAGCAGSYAGGDVGGEPHHFSELRLGPPRSVASAQPAPAASPTPAPAARPAAPPETAAPPAPAMLARAGSVDEVRRRLDAFLATAGFQSEDARSASSDEITATRMTQAGDGLEDAVCSLEAMHRPQMYSTTLDVRLAPSTEGVQVGVKARFVEIDRGVISGVLSRRTCASRGVLEAAIRRAALAG